MSVPQKESPHQYGYIIVWGREKRWETGKKMCMHGALLGYRNPHRSRAWVPQVYPTVYLSHR